MTSSELTDVQDASVFRESLVRRADARNMEGCNLWYGWAIVEGYLAGLKAGRAEAKNDWQPLATAPKDGTRVLLCLNPGGPVVVGWWGPKFSAYGVNYKDDWGFGPNWNQRFRFPPIYWMPLPEPPEAKP